MDLIGERLRRQRLSAGRLERPEDVVAWMTAIQAQDLPGAMWAVGQRGRGITEAAVEAALADGRILRTHVLRPTWHLVTPADIRWLLALTAPRVKARMAAYRPAVGLDATAFARATRAFARALEGGRQLTRAELVQVLARAGISGLDTIRMAHLLMDAELDGVICSGARRGKLITYALLDERVPPARVPARDEALATLAERYFAAHGPATARDLAWWASLTRPEAQRAIELARPRLRRHASRAGVLFAPAAPAPRSRPAASLLLPNYDELIVGYADRAAIAPGVDSALLFKNLLVGGKRALGTWKRAVGKRELEIVLSPFAALAGEQTAAVAAAARRYGEFLGVPATVRTP